MIRRPPRSTLSSSSAASDVYKRQIAPYNHPAKVGGMPFLQRFLDFQLTPNLMNDEHLTTNQGVPVTDNQSSLTVGERGPVLLQDVHLIEKLAHFDRERIAERVVHAKGAGAHGYFQVYKSMAPYTCCLLYTSDAADEEDSVDL